MSRGLYNKYIITKMERCKCGRFMKRLRTKDELQWLPATTGFPPDRLNMAATFPFAPFRCDNHSIGKIKAGI